MKKTAAAWRTCSGTCLGLGSGLTLTLTLTLALALALYPSPNPNQVAARLVESPLLFPGFILGTTALVHAARLATRLPALTLTTTLNPDPNPLPEPYPITLNPCP